MTLHLPVTMEPNEADRVERARAGGWVTPEDAEQARRLLDEDALEGGFSTATLAAYELLKGSTGNDLRTRLEALLTRYREDRLPIQYADLAGLLNGNR